MNRFWLVAVVGVWLATSMGYAAQDRLAVGSPDKAAIVGVWTLDKDASDRPGQMGGRGADGGGRQPGGGMGGGGGRGGGMGGGLLGGMDAAGPALVLALALQPLEQAAGLERVVATCLESASWAGRQGIEALYRESIAIFNQGDPPEPGVFGQPVAFDCIPALGEIDAAGSSERERQISACLARLLAPPSRVALHFLQVPVFVGFGATLALETTRPLTPALAEEALGKAPGIERWQGFADGATLRATAGRDTVLVGRVRADPSRENGLLMWLAADVLRLTAANAVQLATQQLSPLH